MAIILAPKRGNTFDLFLKLLENSNEFIFKCKENYNDHIWKKHKELLKDENYEPGNHYPLFLEMKWRPEYLRQFSSCEE